MEKKTQEEISEDLQKEFVQDLFPECGGEEKIEEKTKGWKWDIDHICTECHMG